ncbi:MULTISPECIES: ComEC/Rec2 family competence protein [unclassified Yoonia]|uniref:ComEC/Rec2 family competence protein n=1 Tax=unclassified Yoonia TaxID=2629118 RepID=UPI002AFFC803|nr:MULTISPECIES: ComEC/Rec2 family competence protein [unclassified Yoonia]
MRQWVSDALLAQRGGLLCWVPVCLALGIGWYFAQAQEPGAEVFWGFAGLGALLLLAARLIAVAWRPILLALVLALLGAGLAKYRTEAVAAPMLGFRYYGAIEGRVVDIDRSASDAIRLTLDNVVLERMAPDRTPERVRVSVHGDQLLDEFRPGDVLIMTGHLSPAAGPAEPGGFDFQRHAWFLGLGAVGYTRNPVLRLDSPGASDWGMRIFALRMAVSLAVRSAIPGEAGAFAAAIMTGDRSGMSQQTLDDLRKSNLAHLLAISGLHMGLLTGFVFAVIRYGLALVPFIALRLATKKIAALVALIVGAFYLALSGGNVATERAFIMAAVVLVAVLLDRRALTLRAVAIAAMIVLVWQPEALTGPGFQMSFAATVALIAVFRGLRRVDLHRLPRWSRPALSVFLSSLVAGLATAPYAAAHFNMMSHFGLIANLASVPLMGLLVMPAAVLATCLAPLGLDGIGFALMEAGLRWILFVAATAAAPDNAVSYVMAPAGAVLPLLTLGLLWLILWQGRARFAGLGLAVLAFVIWQDSTRPALLVADDGGLIGRLGPQGRALSKATGGSFVAGIWLENDGVPVAQDAAAARDGLQREGRVVTAVLGDWQVSQVSGKTALAELQGCGGADVLVVNQRDAVARPCEVFDLIRLRDTGALALDLGADGDLIIATAQTAAGNRPWNGRDGPPAAALVLSRQ